MRVQDADLNLLVVFDALMSERTVSAAAVRLGLSQPACSRALAKLRRQFDDPLFVRSGAVMAPTKLAELLAPEVRDLLDLADRVVNQTVRFDPLVSERDLVVCCSDYLTLVLMSQVVSRLRTEAPRMRLHLVPYQANALSLLRHSGIDLLVEPMSFRNLEGLSSIALFEDRWRVAMWAGSRLASSEMDAGMFCAAPQLRYSLGVERSESLADRSLAALGIDVEPTVTTANFALVPALLHGTDLVSLIAERGGRLLADAHDIVLRDPPFDLPPLRQALFWSHRDDEDPAHRWFRDLIAEVSATLT